MKFNIIILGFVFLLIVTPFIAATEIQSMPITITAKNISAWNVTLNNSIKLNISISSIDYKATETFILSVTKGTLVNSNKTIPFYFNYVGGGVNLTSSQVLNITVCNSNLLKCLSDSAGYSNAYNVCKYDQGNLTKLNNNLSDCKLNLKLKDVDLATKDTQITTLQTDADAKKNSHWLWAIGGVIAGIVGILGYQGKLGGGVRDKSIGEFNKQQAG